MGIDLVEGAVLAGHFRLERHIGEGGMGIVWAATNTMTLRRVALKVLKGERAADPRVRRRFLREGRAASRVRHPNVVEILDVLELEDGSPTMVMELLEGETLGHRLRREKKLPLDATISILLPAISAVGTAHTLGIVHRDLKPENIFLSREPDGTMRVKVLDFGIAKMDAIEGEPGQTEGLTGTGAMLGTPFYMSPEQVFAEEVVDHRSDIWAFGIILYECLAGFRPTQADNVGQIVKIIATQAIVPLDKVTTGLPQDVVDLVAKMLRTEKNERPQALGEVRDALRRHSDVSVTSFGDPVAKVPSLDASSSGGHGAMKARDLALLIDTHPDGPGGGGGGQTRTRTEVPPEVYSGAIETQNSLGLSLSGRRKPKRLRFYAGAAAMAVLSLGFGAWLELRPRSPAVMGSTAVASPGVPITSLAPPPVREIPPPPEATTVVAAPSETPSAPAALPRTTTGQKPRPKAPVTQSTGVTAAGNVAGAASVAPSGTGGTKPTPPGGLVDKPPF
jgi:eukaryotic-like serine/threonine-protein kinase